MSNNLAEVYFNFDQPQTLGDSQLAVSQGVIDTLARKKNRRVIFEDEEELKSNEQLRAVHQLISLLIPRFSDFYGVKYNRDSAKIEAKNYCKFWRPMTEAEAVCEMLKIKRDNRMLGIILTIKQCQEIVSKLQETELVAKSFEKATKEELMVVIEKLLALGDQMEWPEIKLISRNS